MTTMTSSRASEIDKMVFIDSTWAQSKTIFKDPRLQGNGIDAYMSLGHVPDNALAHRPVRPPAYFRADKDWQNLSDRETNFHLNYHKSPCIADESVCHTFDGVDFAFTCYKMSKFVSCVISLLRAPFSPDYLDVVICFLSSRRTAMRRCGESQLALLALSARQTRQLFGHHRSHLLRYGVPGRVPPGELQRPLWWPALLLPLFLPQDERTALSQVVTQIAADAVLTNFASMFCKQKKDHKLLQQLFLHNKQLEPWIIAVYYCWLVRSSLIRRTTRSFHYHWIESSVRRG